MFCNYFVSLNINILYNAEYKYVKHFVFSAGGRVVGRSNRLTPTGEREEVRRFF